MYPPPGAGPAPHRYVLETSRLRLREMSRADLDFIAEMLADPDVMRYYPSVLSRQEAAGWIARQVVRYAENGHGLWLVEERAIGRPVGQVGLAVQQVDGVAEPEVAYLMHRPFWRRGFATEAATAVRDHAFTTFRLPRVISLIRPANAPSQGVARKLGMRPERETEFKGYRHVVFAVTASGAR